MFPATDPKEEGKKGVPCAVMSHFNSRPLSELHAGGSKCAWEMSGYNGRTTSADERSVDSPGAPKISVSNTKRNK